MKIWTKIKSSVLQLSILVVVMVGIVLLSLITLTHTHSFFRLKSENLTEQLSANEAFFFSDSKIKPSDSIVVERNFRGGFELVTVSSNSGVGVKKIGLVGVSNQNKALYLANNNQPLVLVGNAEINGNVSLSERGVKAGSIAGNYFQGDGLPNGNVKLSGTSLPALENTFIDQIKELRNNSLLKSESTINLEAGLKNSFYDSEKVIYSNTKIQLFESVTGNIRIQSEDEISVSRNALLTDVILVAPKIRIEKGFRGNVHLVASDSIIVEEDVHLEYPSSMVLTSEDNLKIPSAIAISDGSIVNGVLIYLPSKERSSEAEDRGKTKTNVFISEKAKLNGSLYCNGYLELQGIVYGSVYTNYFLTKASGSSYINHLMDGKIIKRKQSENFGYLPFQEPEKNVVKWMY